MTTVVKTNPGLNTLFDSFFMGNGYMNKTSKGFDPQVDILENDKAFEISFIIPGMKKEEIAIQIEEEVLKVSGERKFEKTENTKYHRLESAFGNFKRAFNLPKEVDAERIEAIYAEGILKLTLPKSKEASRKLSIAVQ